VRDAEGNAIDLNEEVGRIAALVFEDAPEGAVIQVLKPSQPRQAGWVMVLIRHPADMRDPAA